MPNCELEIDFYRPDREFRTGERIQGWVRVTPHRNMMCRELHLLVAWATQGDGNASKQSYYQQTLFKGRWQAGEQYEYAFEFSPPEWPLSYRGNLFNVEHFVSVRADTPATTVARCQRAFKLKSGAPRQSSTTAPASQDVARPWMNIVGLSAGSLLLLIGVVATISWSLWWLPMGFAGLATLFISGRTELVHRWLGSAQLDLPAGVVAGEDLPIRLRIEPSSQWRLRSVVATLSCIERVETSRDKQTHRSDWVVCRNTRKLCSDTYLRGGEPVEISHTLPVPATDAVTICLPGQRITWTVEVTLQIAWWPLWVLRRDVEVLPQTCRVENPNPVLSPQSSQDFLHHLRQLNQASQDSHRTSQIIGQMGQQLFELDLSVDHVAETGVDVEDIDYRNGKALIGSFSGTQYAIAVYLPREFSNQTDDLRPGALWSGCGTPIRWDPNCQRIMVLGL